LPVKTDSIHSYFMRWLVVTQFIVVLLALLVWYSYYPVSSGWAWV